MENDSAPVPAAPPPSPPPAQTELPVTKRNLSAVQVGVALGIAVIVMGGIAGGYYYLGRSVPAVRPTVAARPVPEAAGQTQLGLDLTSPADGMVSTGNMLQVTGKTLPNIPIVFFTDTHDGSVNSDAQGNFSGTIQLDSGINTLAVMASTQDGQEKTITMDVVYDNQVLGDKTGSNDNGGSDNGEKGKALIGQVEKMTGQKITLKNDQEASGESVEIDQKTKIVGKLKVDDKIAAIWENETASGEGGLKRAIKIFVKPASESGELSQSKREAIQGIVTNISGNTLTVTHQIQRNRVFTVILNSQTVIKFNGVADATASAIQVGQRIVAMGENTGNNTIVAKRVIVIPGKATGILEHEPLPTETPEATASPTLIPPTETPTPLPPSPTL